MAGAVMASTPIVVTVNVTGVSAQSRVSSGRGTGAARYGVRAIVSARTDVAAPAGMADATKSPPTAATLPAATRNSGLCMGFPPVELVKA